MRWFGKTSLQFIYFLRIFWRYLSCDAGSEYFNDRSSLIFLIILT